MAAPTLTINVGGELEISGGNSGDPVTWDDVWNWDDGGGSSGGDGDVPIDGGGTAKVSAYMTETVTNAVYLILDNVTFGDGSASSYFASENEMIYLDDGKCFEVKGNATLRLGDVASGFGIKGSTWSIGPPSNCNLTNHADATLLGYASELHLRTGNTATFNLGTHVFTNMTFSGRHPDVGILNQFVFKSGTFNIKNSFLSRLSSFLISPATIENLQIHNTNGSGMSPASSNTLTGMSFTALDTIFMAVPAVEIIFIDISGTITPAILFDAGMTITLQNTCNIHVTDIDGAALQNVTVDCEFAHLVEGSDGKTYKCSTDFTATDDEFKPIDGSGDWESKWDLYDAGGGLGGDWNNASFDFKAGEEEFAQQTTDANGDISEQLIQYKKWAGANVLEARIHKFTYAHASYPDSVINNIIVDHPLVWEFDMGQSDSDLTALMVAAVAGTDVVLADGVTHGGFNALLHLRRLHVITSTEEETAVKFFSESKDGLQIEGGRHGISTEGQTGDGINATGVKDISAKEIDAIPTFATTGVTVGGSMTYGELLKILSAWIAGNVRDKGGSPGVYEVLDADDGSVVMTLTPSETTPQKDITVNL